MAGKPAPPKPPKPGDCGKKLASDCASAKAQGSAKCLSCTIAHIADLSAAGCNSTAIFNYCHMQ